jgi:hypothetical protein
MAGSAGSSGAAGTAGSAGTGFMYEPPACDYATPLAAACARTACHRPPAGTIATAAGLDLQSPGVEARLIDVVATHGDISCTPDGGGLPVDCIPSTCPPAGTTRLVDRAVPANSWMLKKLNETHNDCGDTMPIAPGMFMTAAEKDCLIAWINAMAAAQ